MRRRFNFSVKAKSLEVQTSPGTSQNSMPSVPGQTLREGFQILREYPSHDGRLLRGITIITLFDESRESRVSKQYLLTWDSKGIYMWDSVQIIKRIRFPKAQQNFISSISYISKLGGIEFTPSQPLAHSYLHSLSIFCSSTRYVFQNL